MTTILILGGNFGGMTSAFELQRKLRKKARVVVVSRQKEFVYIPSLIWVPFGRRTLKDITFSAEETFRHGGIKFVHDEAVRISPDTNTVRCASGRELTYDFLIIAPGAELLWDSIPGLGPKHFTHSIFTPPDAEATYAAFAVVKMINIDHSDYIGHNGLYGRTAQGKAGTDRDADCDRD